jgi:hypothetical protein
MQRHSLRSRKKLIVGQDQPDEWPDLIRYG